MQHERHADQTVAREVDARIDDAAVSFAADDGVCLLHLVGDVYFTNLRQEQRTAKLICDVGEGRRGREICDDWTTLASEHVKRGEDERVVFADRNSFFGNDREPIRVHVLRETDVCSVFFDCFTKRAEVLRYRFSRTWT